MTKYAIIVAGGSGTRMDADVPKQFMLLCGMPVLMHSIQKFDDGKTEIIAVLPETLFDDWKKLCIEYKFSVPHVCAKGGVSRTESVKNGLQLVADNNSLVAVHDASRPLVSKTLIENLFAVAEKKGNAIPCVPVADSLRMIEAGSSHPVDRNNFLAVQTPQVFQTRILKEAFAKSQNKEFTDEASLVQHTGEKINTVTGETTNIKITFPADLIVAATLMKQAG